MVRWLPRCLLLWAGSLAMLAGCSKQANPFDMAQVGGKITYSDGKPIDAAVVKVFFVPQDIPAVGEKHARTAQATLGKDGGIESVSTAGLNDGLAVGRHKVVLQPCNADLTLRLSAVAAKYCNPMTTPLEIEVTRQGPNRFELKVEKGP